MTVSTTANKITFIADGVTSTFPFTFAMPASSQTAIAVYLTTTAGVITQLTYLTQFTVVLNAAISPNPTGIGGTVTTLSTPANGTLVTILRTLPETQTTSLANQGNLYQPVLEAMADSQEMQVQQISELQGRAIVVAVSDNAPTALPPAAQRANLVMGFDSSGNPTAVSTAPAGTISSAMAPFVASASIAAAKALLGYGSMANENIGAAGKGIADDGAGNARVNQTVTAVAASQSPAAAQHMTNYASTGTNTFNLPKLTNVFNGYELWVFCLTNTATLAPNAADNFPGAAGGASIVLIQGQCARLIGDGVSAWSILAGRIPGIGSTQTRQTFTSGSGATYTTPAGCRRIVVRFVAGGGGGSGSTGGGNGGDTTFNSVTAGGGVGAGTPTAGTGGTGGAGAASLRLPGSDGGTGGTGNAGNTPTEALGGAGSIGSAGKGGNGNNPGAGFTGGGGGGSGEYCELIINNPATTYSYTVGAAGIAGTGSSPPKAGLIVVDEYYQ